MTGRITDHKNLYLAKLHREVVKGASNGKIIWQPRIGCWYTDKKFAGEKLPEPYEGMTRPAIYKELGCSARIYEDYNRCFKQVDDSKVRRYRNKLSERETEYVVETPVGKITSIGLSTPNSSREIKKKWWITCEEDMNVAAWVEERCSWEWDQMAYDEVREQWGNIGAPTMFMPCVNIQHLYINMMGVEETVYALYDYADIVEKYFQILDESQLLLRHSQPKCTMLI